jgi:hypothetical protein
MRSGNWFRPRPDMPQLSLRGRPSRPPNVHPAQPRKHAAHLTKQTAIVPFLIYTYAVTSLTFKARVTNRATCPADLIALPQLTHLCLSWPDDILFGRSDQFFKALVLITALNEPGGVCKIQHAVFGLTPLFLSNLQQPFDSAVNDLKLLRYAPGIGKVRDHEPRHLLTF